MSVSVDDVLFGWLEFGACEKFLCHLRNAVILTFIVSVIMCNRDLRKSVFRPIKDAKLFNLVDNVISGLNEDDDSYRYTLRRNDITHIKYERGGFFKRHRDYLSTTSNLVEEFTLVLCVTPADQAASDQVSGGDTTIHAFGTSKTFDTTTTGCGILFRKDLEHEGMELKSGEKHIITANIWATRKEDEQSKQVLLVTFPTAEESEGTRHHTLYPLTIVSTENMLTFCNS